MPLMAVWLPVCFLSQMLRAKCKPYSDLEGSLSFLHLWGPLLCCHSDPDYCFQMSYFIGFDIILLYIRNISGAHLARQKAEHRKSHLLELGYLEGKGNATLLSISLAVPEYLLKWHRSKVTAIWLQRCRDFSTVH